MWTRTTPTTAVILLHLKLNTFEKYHLPASIRARLELKYLVFKALLTVDDLEIVTGWLLGLPLGARLTGSASSSKERKRGVSGGVINL